MKISNKKLKAINQMSFAVSVIKEQEGRTIAGQHWTDTPPEMWSKEEAQLWDTVFMLEHRLKQAIIKEIEK